MGKGTAKWSVTGVVVGNKFLGEYDVESGKQAIEMAREDAVVSLCHHCSSECEDGEITKFVAENGARTVEIDDNEDMNAWQKQARAAGWSPPKKRAAKKRQA